MCNRVSLILAPILFIVAIGNCHAAPCPVRKIESNTAVRDDKAMKELAKRKFNSDDFNRIANAIERNTRKYITQIDGNKSRNDMQTFSVYWSNAYPIQFNWNFNEQPGITRKQYTNRVEHLYVPFNHIFNHMTIAGNTIDERSIEAGKIHNVINKKLGDALCSMHMFLTTENVTIPTEAATEQAERWTDIEYGMYYVYLTNAMRKFQKITEMFVKS